MTKLSVIIVSYNVKYYLEQCLKSVFASSIKTDEIEVFVVDNASPDSSPVYLRSQFPKTEYPQLHIISNNRNVGFGTANNQALALAQGKYVLFLNPDTLLGERTLEQCLDFAEGRADFGGLGTMMMHDNGLFAFESRRGMPTPWVSFCKMAGLNALFPKSKRFGRYYMRYLDKEKPASIEIISGAFMLVKHSVLDEVGGFDEDFFMYGEDIDLSYRILKGGYRNYYFPSPILHYKGESTKKNTFKYVHVFYNAMLIFFKKHYHSYWVGLSVPIKFAIVVSAILALMKQQLLTLRHFLLPSKRLPKEELLYIGRHFDTFSALANEWRLNVDCVSSDQQALNLPEIMDMLGKKNYMRIIFDTDNFSYDFMLDLLNKSDHKYYLGIYHSDINMLITGARTYLPQTIVL